MLYMVLETFKDPLAVYRRFRDQGRLAPDNLHYLGSWVTEDFKRCYQVMECDERRTLDAWIERWEDLVEVEVIPVVTSADAYTALNPRL